MYLSLIPGKHNGQVYIQTSEPFNPVQENVAARIGDLSGNAVARRSEQVTWRPYLTSSPSRTPTVVTKDLAVWNPMEYPFGKVNNNNNNNIKFIVRKFHKMFKCALQD